MARLTLWKIRYDPRGGETASPDVVVTLRGADGGEERLPVDGATLHPGEGVNLNHGGFGMVGPVTVEVAPASGGAPVGSFEVPEEEISPATARDNWDVAQDARARYTVSFRVDLEGRGVVDPHTLRSRVCDVIVARNSENCLTPGERGVAMATQHDREKLIYGTNFSIEGTRVPPAPNAVRAAYIAAPGPILGPRHVDPALYPGDAQLAAAGGNMVVAKRADASTVFRPGARDLARYYEDRWGAGTMTVRLIDNGVDPPLGPGHSGEGDTRKGPQRLNDVIAVLNGLAGDPPLSLVAFFCHGWQNGFQLGGNNTGRNGNMGAPEIQRLSDAIKAVARKDVVVALYACLTAKGAPGACFAGKLRDALIAAPNALPYCRVIGHTTAAHAYRSPDIRIFEGADGAGAAGWEPGPRARLIARLKDDTEADPNPWPAFRWAYPLMSREAIEAFMADPSPPAGVFPMP